MWWYRDREEDETPPTDDEQDRTVALVSALCSCDLGPDRLRGSCVAMAVLVDHEIVWSDDGSVLRPSWQDAEALIQRASASDDPSHLYNDFARHFGDGFTDRADLAPEDRLVVEGVLDGLRKADGVAEVRRRPASVDAPADGESTDS